MALDPGKESCWDFPAGARGVAPPAARHTRCLTLLALQTGLHPLLTNEHCRELELPLWHRQHDPGWKSWIHGMVWGPALIAPLPRGASPAIPAHGALHWAQLCQGFWGHTGNGKEPGALKNHYLGFFRLIGVNCLGSLKNSSANGKCGC